MLAVVAPRAVARRDRKVVDALAVGRRIAQARRKTGLTQRELAASLGITVRSLQYYESGAVVPYRQLPQLTALLARPSAWRLYGEDTRARAAESAVLASATRELNGRVAALERQVATMHERFTQLRARMAELAEIRPSQNASP